MLSGGRLQLSLLLNQSENFSVFRLSISSFLTLLFNRGSSVFSVLPPAVWSDGALCFSFVSFLKRFEWPLAEIVHINKAAVLQHEEGLHRAVTA